MEHLDQTQHSAPRLEFKSFDDKDITNGIGNFRDKPFSNSVRAYSRFMRDQVNADPNDIFKVATYLGDDISHRFQKIREGNEGRLKLSDEDKVQLKDYTKQLRLVEDKLSKGRKGMLRYQYESLAVTNPEVSSILNKRK